jgi:hypothetical protein
MDRFMEKRNAKDNFTVYFLSYSSLILFLITVSSVSFALAKNSTTFIDTKITELDNNMISVTSQLVQLQVPESKTNLLNDLQQGTVEESLLVGSYQYSPVVGQAVDVYLVDSSNNHLKVCTNTTDTNGRFWCLVQLQNPNVFVNIKFNGTANLYKTEANYPVSITPQFPSFLGLIDEGWFIIFFILGVLVAALYAAGKKPLSAFDITTPKKIKGIKTPKATKLKSAVDLSGSGVASKFSESVSRLYKLGKKDVRLLPAIVVAEKYLPDPKNELKDVYNANSDFQATLKLTELISRKGVKSKLVNMLEQSKSNLNKLQIEKQRIEKNKGKYEKWQDLEKVSLLEKRIQMRINEETEKIRQYEKDLKSLSEERLISVVGLNTVDINKFKETRRKIDSIVISDLVKCIDNKLNSINFQDVQKEIESSSLADKKETEDNLKLVLKTKLELDKIYINQAINALNKINSDPDAFSHKEWQIYQKLQDSKLSENETAEILSDLLEIYGESHSEEKDEINKLTNNIKQITKTRASYEKSLEKFEYDFEKYQSSKSEKEKYAFNSLIDFNILHKKSSDYLSDIDKYPEFEKEVKLDPEVSKFVFNIYSNGVDEDLLIAELSSIAVTERISSNTLEFINKKLSNLKSNKKAEKG